MNSKKPMIIQLNIMTLSLTGLPGNHLKKQITTMIVKSMFAGEQTLPIASFEAENRAIPTPFF